MHPIPILQIGMGPLGQRITRFLRERRALRLVGAVDIDPDKTGTDAGTRAGGPPLDVSIAGTLTEALATCEPQVALVTTVSSIRSVAPQIEAVVAQGLPVVSTCEELSYPWDAAPAAARAIDRAARAHGVAVLGTGVNPGFLMDLLPLCLTAVCQRVDRIEVERIQDAATRRGPFQKKIGAGLDLETFDQRKRAGTLRHVGLTESMQMIAHRMGWSLEKTSDVIAPVVATQRIETDALTIEPGQAAGVEQIGTATCGGRACIRLVFRAAVGEPDPHDSVSVEGVPSFRSVIPGGIHGDIATCAITLNAVGQIRTAAPGLRTMADLPPVSFFADLDAQAAAPDAQ
jgi:4-hydroxy-tetrahydrodipicolinate reductase